MGYKPLNNYYWIPWLYNNQVSGYYTMLDTQNITNTKAKFQLATVHSAGHMIQRKFGYYLVEILNRVGCNRIFSAPWTQPGRSLQSLKNWLNNEW